MEAGSDSMTHKPIAKILVPAGALGIPYDRQALTRGLKESPNLIAIDGGSTDSGPFYLGSGTSKYSRQATKSDWSELMAARAEAGIPLLIGTAGTCGTNDSVDWMIEITREIAQERGETIKIASVKSSQDPQVIAEAWRAGKISKLEGAPEINADEIAELTNIVALAGVEPLQAALATDADIIIAGRATDTAIIAALPLTMNCDPGAAWHGAKIGECGALATNNPNSGVILLSFDESGFTIKPMAENAQATQQTVAAHMLYENADPFILHEPGGYLDVREARYECFENKSVRVEGSKWHTTCPYKVKLEGARLAGFQTVSMVLLRDQNYVKNIRQWVAKLQDSFTRKISKNNMPNVKLELRIIGLDATLGALETREEPSAELAVMAIFTAAEQKLANEAAKLLNPDLLHLPLESHEPMPTFAFPFSPPEMVRGPLYEFCLHHVMEVADPLSAFRIEVNEVK